MKTMKSIFLTVSMLLLAAGSFAQEAEKKAVETVKIKTTAECDMCKNTIEKKLIYEKGVKSVSVDVDSRIATVEYKTAKTDVAKIREAISDLGYDADEVKADSKGYDALPQCCKDNLEGH